VTINTGVSSALLAPKTFHSIVYLQGGSSLVTLTQRAVMIGNKSTAGTATAGSVYAVNDPNEADTLFGIGSPLALMCRKAFAQAKRNGGGPLLFAVPLAETTTARVNTITVTGPATADGDVVLRIAGRKLVIGVANGSSATTIALAISNKIGELKQSLPITAAPAVGVVTCTCVVKGTFGADIVYEVVSYPAGTTVVAAQTVAGVGALDIQTALDAIVALEFDGVAIQTHASGDITEINTHIAATWSASAKKPRWFFIGEPGSIGTATALASAANHEGVIVLSYEQSPSLPCEIATAAMIRWLSRDRPNGNYNNSTLELQQPADIYAYTDTELESALAAGLTPLMPVVRNGAVVDAITRIVRLITTRTTLNSQPSLLLIDIGTSRTAWYIATQIDRGYAAKIASESDPDGGLADDDTRDKIRDLVADVNMAAQERKILKNVKANLASLLVELDAVVPTRFNIDNPINPVGIANQAAFVHRVTVG
jgi:phage tail sheath gpL-like